MISHGRRRRAGEAASLLIIAALWGAGCGTSGDSGANWPSGSDAKFGNLRAYGAFLVSSEIQGNAIPYVRVVSENGGPFTLSNPWPGKSMVVYRNGVGVGTLSGTTATIDGCANDSIFVAPDGTSYASIVALVNAQ